MNLTFRGIQVPMDESLLYPAEIEQVRQCPTGGVMHALWANLWEGAFRPGDTVLDIGANVGIISISLALLGGVVHAIEGSPRNYSRLQRLCEPLRQITVHPVALDADSRVQVNRFNDCIGLEHPEQRIAYKHYDTYAKEVVIADPAFVKMDIEGMESVALHGMSKLIHDVRPVWQIEYHPSLQFRYEGYPGFVTVARGGFDFATFTEAGYRILNQDLEPVDALTTDGNYFFMP